VRNFTTDFFSEFHFFKPFFFSEMEISANPIGNYTGLGLYMGSVPPRAKGTGIKMTKLFQSWNGGFPPTRSGQSDLYQDDPHFNHFIQPPRFRKMDFRPNCEKVK